MKVWAAPHVLRLGLSVFLILMASLLPYFFPAPWSGIERLAADARIRLSQVFPGGPPERRIVLVDIDEASLAGIGAWPWPRDKTAHLVEVLTHHYQAAGVALDIVFPESKPQDDSLALALADPRVYEAVVYGNGGPSEPRVVLNNPSVRVIVPKGFPLAPMHPAVASNAGLQTDRAGHINPHFDQDGVVRRIPAVLCDDGRCHLPLAFALYLGLVGQSQVAIEKGPWWGSAWQMNVEGLRPVPIDAQGFIQVPYRTARSRWTALSAQNVLQEAIPLDMLNNSLVIVGSTALGLSDKVASPVGNLVSGMEVHAELLRGLLDDDFFLPEKSFWAPYCLILGGFSGLLAWSESRRRKAVLKGMFMAFSLAGLLALGLLVWAGLYWWARVSLPLAPLVVFFTLGPLSFLVLEWLEAEWGRAGAQRVLGHYLPHEEADRLIGRADDTESMDAREQTITVLFADIRGFTALTEKMSSQAIAELTQEIFRTLGQVIERHGGTIDKFMGDSVLAFWNSPQFQDNHAGKALRAARDIVETIERLAPSGLKPGAEGLKIGIGIESGVAQVGHFGSSSRRTYTALGEPVVLATRIEEFTRDLPSSILCGPEAFRLLGEQALAPVQEVTIRGRDKPLWLYAPRSLL
jgi:adenylate cyclase